MEFLDLAQSMALTAELHARGHQGESNSLGFPMSIHHREGLEHFRDRTPKDKKILADIDGAGFAAQDAISKRLDEDSEFARSFRLANALYKVAYAFGSHRLMGGQIDGDIENMEKESGNRYTKHLLGISAAFDYLKSRGELKHHDVSFDVIDGAPGLTWTMRW